MFGYGCCYNYGGGFYSGWSQAYDVYGEAWTWMGW